MSVVSGSVQPDDHWLKVVPAVPVPFDPAPGEIGTLVPPSIRGFARLMVDGAGLLVERPQSPEPVVTGNTVDIPPCMSSTVVTIDDGFEVMVTETAGVDGWTATYTLPDAGAYRVEVVSPLPAVPSIRRLTVT
ncbi:hypothetical protein QO034_18850 [Sedimentitalea sp. JM2-8]|uniref:Uncharacterized protein n=1 Tax=Sedimentitalea xiamensis TaxID=3050037 RepID=A0ABT7FJ31_9RHOB|nr:hypothetical protein [Sedimentitalea xiamensis]MDK3075151.1 hypothetical protein [Sedimentitalea xiamensis]